MKAGTVCGVATTEKDLLSLNGGRWVVSVPPARSVDDSADRARALSRACASWSRLGGYPNHTKIVPLYASDDSHLIRSKCQDKSAYIMKNVICSHPQHSVKCSCTFLYILCNKTNARSGNGFALLMKTYTSVNSNTISRYANVWRITLWSAMRSTALHRALTLLCNA